MNTKEYFETRSNKTKLNRSENRIRIALEKEGIKTNSQTDFIKKTVDLTVQNKKIIIEIDGPSHETEEGKETDRRRDFYSTKAGWKTLRYPAHKACYYPIRLAKIIKQDIKEIEQQNFYEAS